MKSSSQWLVFIVVSSIFITVLNLSSFFSMPNLQKMNVFPDDAFYYLMPALNIAKGNGPTADGTNLTSGYHPLWMGILASAARLSGENKQKLFVFSVTSGALLHTLTAVIVYITATAVCPPYISGILSLMYLLCADALKESIGGSEAALLAFLIALFILLESKKDGLRILKGIVLGCIFLARTDAFMFVALFYFFSFIKGSIASGMPSAIRKLGLSAVFTLLTALPWFLISKAVYGTLTQNSMMMKLLWRARYFSGKTFFDKAYFSLAMFKSWLVAQRTCTRFYCFCLPYWQATLFISMLQAFETKSRLHRQNNAY